MKERNITWEYLWSEVWNLFKFGVVGFSSLGINAATYALLSRVLWTSGPRTLMSVIAVCVSAVFNFTLHRAWTFQTRAFSTGMLARYVVVVIVGTTMQGILFYLGHEVLKIYDFVVLVGSSCLIAIGSYALHRWYTFHPRHEAAK